jgi:hypothetical protein
MADENTSRLLIDSAKFRDKLLIAQTDTQPFKRYTSSNCYADGHPNTISDGDCFGRQQVDNGTIGTNLDIACRNSLSVAETPNQPFERYTSEKPYGEGNC